MKRLLAAVLAAAVAAFPIPLPMNAEAASMTVKRFDFGGLGAAEGFTGVSASERYSAAKGYGFANTDAVENVKASGAGALADAVRFKSDVPNHIFHVDLPAGVYKITVTTGDVRSATITAEGVPQLFFLTGSNASDSFTIPVRDGQLNLYAGAGVGTEFSISTLEIEQTEAKPTIWVAGDSTAASCYNVTDDAVHGWGQYLYRYVNTAQYDVRNISASGVTSDDLRGYLFETAEHYGKNGDILLLAAGINDYTKQNTANPDPADYKTNMTDMIRRAWAKGMFVYLVKQHGQKSDTAKYPLPKYRWFGAEIDELAKAEQTGVIDLFRPWLEFSLENNYFAQIEYYTQDDLHLNARGAEKQAEMVSQQLFPPAKPALIGDDGYDLGIPTAVYQTAVSGEAVSNPHKGFVMTAYTPSMIEDFQYGIGGSADNHAWDVVTIVSGSPHWDDLNPEKGVYNWDEIDAMLEACERHGLTYGIRIMPYSSYLKEDYVPQWVYDAGAKKNTAESRDNPGETVVFPKWDDPVYLQAHKDFVKALAEKYDGDPRVEFVDVRPFGDFGEWHNAFAVGGDQFMPSLEIQKDMLDCYAAAFQKTMTVLPSNARGAIYQYALSIGITKRDDGLISIANAEWSLLPAYRANMPVVGENYWPYAWMRDTVRENEYSHVNWTPERFRETIEIPHMSIFALDQDSHCSYEFYQEQKAVIDEMCNKLGYHFTVTSAARYGNRLAVRIRNNGLAPAYFTIDLCAEITDAGGNRLESFGKPLRIEKGSFRDGTEKTFLFEYDGVLDENAVLCLAMYDSDNPLAAGKDPTVRFDNKNTLTTNRLQLVPAERVTGDVNADGALTAADAVLLQKWLLAVPDVHLANWKAVDFYKDDKLDAADLSLMKQALVTEPVRDYVEPDEHFEYGVPFFVKRDGLKLYLGPDESYEAVASIPANTRLIEKGVQNGNNEWLFTEYNGQYGWINTLDSDGKMVIYFEEAARKPVIYLYPEEETDVHVELELTESELNTTYPKYDNGWDVVANPDGTLLNKADGSHHRYLFWDSVNCRTRFDFSTGFCVAGSDTERFLKEKLTDMGLTEQEMNEFIVYWLPLMEHNAYNLISFQGDAYTNSAKLTITPTPDSECRIFMAYVPLENAVEIEPQQLEPFERKGFAVVEWGGVEIRQ